MIHEDLTVYCRASEIESLVRNVAAGINADYRGREALIVGVLKGACLFYGDLVRHLDFSVTMDFIHVESYGSGTSPSSIALRSGPARLDGQRVILVEDIVDTGRTARFLMSHLRSIGVSDCRLCALLDKPARREVNVKIDYAGMTVPDRFFVGYGMDLDGRYRNLPDICIVNKGLS